MADRFFIAPFEENSGLQNNVRLTFSIIYAKPCIIKQYIKVCILKKFYKRRKDIIDLQDKVFGDLTVIRPGERQKWRGATWICKCICGKECLVLGGQLRSGKRVSCGCRQERYIDQTGVNRIYSNYKRKSRLRNIYFDLDKTTFESLIKGNCNYCRSKPNQILKRLKTRKLQILYNGIDRVDPEKGYVKENCVSCCRYCNQSKSDLTVEQWKIYIQRIYKWLINSL